MNMRERFMRYLMSNAAVGPPKLTRWDFDNPLVLYALNPHPYWGFCHGPMFDPNVVLKPSVIETVEDDESVCLRNFLEFMTSVESEKDAQAAAAVEEAARAKTAVNPDDLAKGINGLDITSKETKRPARRRLPPRPRQLLFINPHSSEICDIIVELPDIMCGYKSSHPADMAAHIRKSHGGAIARPMRYYLDDAWNNCVASLRRWVLTGGWRDAKYRLEPIRLRPGSLIDMFCEDLERIAREDASFAAKYGCQFHRYSAHLTSMDDPEWGEPGYRYKTARAGQVHFPGKDDRFLF